LTEENEIFQKNEFMPSKEENLETGIQTADLKDIKGEIIDIGGVYRNKYALVRDWGFVNEWKLKKL